jgi:hypothetical protein
LLQQQTLFVSTAQSLTLTGMSGEIGFNCDFLDLHSTKNIYLSSNMANYDSINPEGYPSNILKKIPLTSDYGYLIVDNLITLND